MQRVQKRLAILNKRTKGGCSCMCLLLSVIGIVILAVVIWALIKYLWVMLENGHQCSRYFCLVLHLRLFVCAAFRGELGRLACVHLWLQWSCCIFCLSLQTALYKIKEGFCHLMKDLWLLWHLCAQDALYLTICCLPSTSVCIVSNYFRKSKIFANFRCPYIEASMRIDELTLAWSGGNHFMTTAVEQKK